MKKLFSILLTLSLCLSCFGSTMAFAASDSVQSDADALTVADILSVPEWNGNTLIDNLDLDAYTKGEVNESPIIWASTNEEVISTSGIVTRGAEDEEVTITATIGEGEDSLQKAFTFNVPAASKTVNGIPAVGTMKIEDTFSDDEIDSSKINYSVPTSYDSVVEANGKMSLTRAEWTSGEPSLDINYESNGYLITTYEFSMHSTAPYVRIAYVGYNWNGYPLYIHWYPNDNQISIGTAQTQDYNKRINLPASAKGKKAKFTAVFNNPKKTCDLWVNNEIVVLNNPFLVKNDTVAQKPYKIRISTVTTSWMYGVGTISIDNLRIYECTENLALTALKTADSRLVGEINHTENKVNYLTDDAIDLTAIEATNGASVVFASDDEAVISATGKITRALTDKKVTITATATSGDDVIAKSYTFTVPGKYNKIGKNGMPLTDVDYPVNHTVTQNITDTAIQTAFSEENGRVSFTSAYASNKEPGFKYAYSDNLKGTFIQDFAFKSDSAAMRARVTDSAYNRKLDVYFLDKKTLTVVGGTTVSHADSFQGKDVNLRLVYTMSSNSVDIYLNGELWLDDFALISGGHANIQYVQVSHHCATIMGAWRGGQGTTTFYSLNAYKVVDESQISSVMATDVSYSNEGTVASGKNTASLALVAGDEAGEQSGNIIYAIYSNENGVKKLEGIDVVKFTLDEFAHSAYTANVTLDAVPSNASQELFIWNASGILPLEASAFPAQ